MKISETIERNCCDPRKDLIPMEGTPKKEMNRVSEFVFCKHCGSQFRYQTCRDEAGSADWEYVKMPKPW